MGLLLHVSSGLGCVVVELSLWERPASTGQYYGCSERKFRFFTRGPQPGLVKKGSSLEEKMFKRRVRVLNTRCRWGAVWYRAGLWHWRGFLWRRGCRCEDLKVRVQYRWGAEGAQSLRATVLSVSSPLKFSCRKGCPVNYLGNYCDKINELGIIMIQ